MRGIEGKEAFTLPDRYDVDFGEDVFDAFLLGLTEKNQRGEMDKHAIKVLKEEMKKENPDPDIVRRGAFWLVGAQTTKLSDPITKNKEGKQIIREIANLSKGNKFVLETQGHPLESAIRWAKSAVERMGQEKRGK